MHEFQWPSVKFLLRGKNWYDLVLKRRSLVLMLKKCPVLLGNTSQAIASGWRFLKACDQASLCRWRSSTGFFGKEVCLSMNLFHFSF